MGAAEFSCSAKGKTAEEAFDNAVSDAQYESGHGGYTGTIADKDEFTLVRPHQDETISECIARHEEDDTFGDRWGPAGCIEIGTREWLFFGWASS